MKPLKLAALLAGVLCVLALLPYFPDAGGNATTDPVPGLSEEPAGAAPPPKESVRLVFAGDIMVHLPQVKAAKSGDAYRFEPQLEGVGSLLASADIVSGNLETTLSGSKIPYSGYPRFNTPDSLLDALKSLGFNFLCVANNHALDYGKAGFARTVERARSSGFCVAGVVSKDERPIVSVNVRGVRFSFLNYTYGYNEAPGQKGPGPGPAILVKEEVLKDISSARSADKADVIVVIAHWGVEDSPRVTEEQREMARAWHEAGADIVIGAHPHVLQEMEVRSGDRPGVTAWSLGNFVSSQRRPPQQLSALLAIDIEADESQATIRRVLAAPILTVAGRPGAGRQVVPAGGERVAAAFEALRISSRDIPAEPDERGYYILYDREP